MRENGASCSAQGTGVYPHIHVQPYPTSMKITLLQVRDKEYWNCTNKTVCTIISVVSCTTCNAPQNHMETYITPTQCSDWCYLLIYAC